MCIMEECDEAGGADGGQLDRQNKDLWAYLGLGPAELENWRGGFPLEVPDTLADFHELWVATTPGDDARPCIGAVQEVLAAAAGIPPDICMRAAWNLRLQHLQNLLGPEAGARAAGEVDPEADLSFSSLSDFFSFANTLVERVAHESPLFVARERLSPHQGDVLVARQPERAHTHGEALRSPEAARLQRAGASDFGTATMVG